MSGKETSRRDFIKKTGISGLGLIIAGCAEGKGPMLGPGQSPKQIIKGTYKKNEKLNIAGVGVGGKGHSDIAKCEKENVVALCDIDWHRASGAIKKYPNAKKYHDYRKMFDEMGKDIDAITCSTTDHMHAPICCQAMKMGKHVYCQKPLTHDVWEARQMAELSVKHDVATQMGNQGTAHDGFRNAVEALRSGVVGNVTEAHVWTNRPVWPQGKARPKGADPVPDYLKWDLWLGTAPARPYVQFYPGTKSNVYHPFAWRGWWDFGTGALGDMGCHTANMAFMGMELGSPVSAVAQNSGFDKDSFPTWSVIELMFPARKSCDGRDLPPVKWTWYDGGNDKPQWVHNRLKALIHGNKYSGSGSILIGDKGTLYSPNDYGAEWILLPKDNFKDWKQPAPVMPRWGNGNIDQYQTDEWIAACKDKGKKTISNFVYGGRLTEALLLGNIAMFTGEFVKFDGQKCQITNSANGQALIRRQYRKGWEQV
ncbi:MAG: Gfo/Idh/MocA family oxidoreductase [Phycisphaerae bacterium]|nr:Gfo/Idh/MocA family oxidoreductase [Phycisphaerae bacterium]